MRLTDDKTAADLRDIMDGLRSAGREPGIDLLRYIKLAEYEQIGLSIDDIICLLRSNTLLFEENSYLKAKCREINHPMPLPEPPKEE